MSNNVQQNSKGSFGHEVMAVSTLFRAFAFISGVFMFRAGEGSFIRTVTSQVLAVIFLLMMGSHMYVGSSSIIDDYIHDGGSVAFFKFAVTLRIVRSILSNYTIRFGGIL
jgi:succinate dehydrogenase hydrophobic anchor subunit